MLLLLVFFFSFLSSFFFSNKYIDFTHNHIIIDTISSWNMKKKALVNSMKLHVNEDTRKCRRGKQKKNTLQIKSIKYTDHKLDHIFRLVIWWFEVRQAGDDDDMKLFLVGKKLGDGAKFWHSDINPSLCVLQSSRSTKEYIKVNFSDSLIFQLFVSLGSFISGTN